MTTSSYLLAIIMYLTPATASGRLVSFFMNVEPTIWSAAAGKPPNARANEIDGMSAGNTVPSVSPKLMMPPRSVPWFDGALATTRTREANAAVSAPARRMSVDPCTWFPW